MKAGPLIVFNQQFVDGLYSSLDLSDPDRVFEAVFLALDDEVVVYPTENYYYFTLYSAGKTTCGNLRLDASDRDQGVIHLGYFEFDENGTYQDREGHDKAYSATDGIVVTGLAPLVYSVSYSGKTVVFRLNDVGAERPESSRLAGNEVYAGPVFDESGLKFFLVFNEREKHFLYILNENGPVPEHLILISDEVIVGRRTGFAFFNDTKHNRKILIGVHGRSIDRNNYYDGPFDQLPDNYAEQSSISKYIEQAYPFLEGSVDRFGGFRGQNNARALIAPYTVYEDRSELLDLVDRAKKLKLMEDRFYAYLTPDPAQLD
jgi:hypothetical protein